MNHSRNVLLPLGLGLGTFAASVAIAVNHDEAYLDHQRTEVSSIGEYQREHVLGTNIAFGLGGGAIVAAISHRPQLAAKLGAITLGTLAGTYVGHVGWDRYLAREQAREAVGPPS